MLTYLLTYSMEQSPSWEANLFAASQEISSVLWNPKVYYRIHKCPTPVSIMSQLNPIHTSHPPSWRSILILSSHLRLVLPIGFLSLRVPHQNPVHATPFPHPSYMPRLSHLFDFITRTILGKEYKSFSSSLCNFLHSPVVSSLLGPNILLNTLSLRSFLNVSDKVSNPYKKKQAKLYFCIS
jgi:hypothetical protein